MASPTRARYLNTGFLALNPKAFGTEFEVSGVASKPFDEEGSIAVVNISGPLEQHAHYAWDSYEAIDARALAAFASTASKVGIRINSPGGAAAGCFELARRLRAMSIEYRKPLAVFVDGMACSAAYAIACAATAGIYAPPTSSVGSIGVYEMIVDQTAQDAAMGLKFIFVASTGSDLKLAGNPHLPVSDSAQAHTQQQVDILTGLFYGLVEEMRGIPTATLQGLRGAALLASEGVNNSLVDSVSDWSGFLTQLESEGSTMVVQAKSKMPFEECLAALMEAANDDEGENKDKAKKMIAALMAEDEPNGDPKPEPAGKAEAKPDEPEEEKKEEAKASSNELALAARLQALEAKIAIDAETSARAELLAKRPDFSTEVRKSLATASVSFVENAVKTWPRVTSNAGASANAAMPAVVPGKTDNMTPGLRPEQTALLDRIGRRGPQAEAAHVEGVSLVLSPMSSAAAAKRVQEMIEQGIAPKGPGIDFARVSSKEFKVKQ